MPTPDLEFFLSRGYVPLPHKLRQGDETYTWYHGPLGTRDFAPRFNSDADLPAFGDSLVRYHEDVGLFDHSYAAAYELGRSLALDDAAFSSAIYQWKHLFNENAWLEVQAPAAGKLTATPDHVAAKAVEDEAALDDPKALNSLETKIFGWFNDLALLKDLPFNYLVVDEKLLPRESIRFFKLDRHWLECLLFGAFTIGGSLRKNDPEIDVVYPAFKRLTGELTTRTVTGFILRSELVADYPDLLTNAYPQVLANADPLPNVGLTALTRLRGDRVGPDVLSCLFEGDLQTAEVYLKPQGLHYGVDVTTPSTEPTIPGAPPETASLIKEILVKDVYDGLADQIKATDASAKIKSLAQVKSALKTDVSDGSKLDVPIPFRNGDAGKRVVDVAAMASQMALSSANVAREMLDEADAAASQINQGQLAGPITPSRFGMYLLEESNKGRFVIGSPVAVGKTQRQGQGLNS